MLLKVHENRDFNNVIYVIYEYVLTMHVQKLRHNYFACWVLILGLRFLRNLQYTYFAYWVAILGLRFLW